MNRPLIQICAAAAILAALPAIGRCDILANGGFEAAIDGAPGNWDPKTNPNFQIVQDGANHYALFTKTDPNFSAVASETVPVDASWKQVDVEARMKVKHLVVGDQSWQSARVTTVFLDADKKIFKYGNASTLWADTNWVTRTLRVDVPAGAKFLSVQVGVFGPAGEMGVDDVKLIPNPSFTAPPLPVPFDGSFEKVDANGDPIGWPTGGSGWAVESSAGNHFLRAVNKTTASRPEARLAYAVNPAWKTLTVSARIRGKDVKPGTGSGQAPGMNLAFLDATGNQIYPLPVSGIEITADSDWAEKSGTFTVPGNAKFFILVPIMRNCTGQCDIDDVKIIGNS
ncbi:MAG TPA: hypothetical protein VGK19_25585 [Capsulimonadaceae bacterium]|jgi:hypothetical protein